LWRERVVEHAGEFFEFGPVAFEPKPVQQPLPLHVGGDSSAALRRAARAAEGWIGMIHTPDSFAVATATLRRFCLEAGRPDDAVMCTALGGHPSPADVDAWAVAGCHRLIVAPWSRSADALDGLRAFATAMALHPRA
jgi:alkanesulfonate monooxygenase SsuD/methylene tetrahydromethanopterin reductase-like flavin-dependent oxidoreductase (luciferase family)